MNKKRKNDLFCIRLFCVKVLNAKKKAMLKLTFFLFGFIYLLLIFLITAISDSIYLDLLGFTSSIYFDLLRFTSLDSSTK